MRVRSLAQEHNAVPQPRFERGPLESGIPTIRPLCLPRGSIKSWLFVKKVVNVYDLKTQNTLSNLLLKLNGVNM